MTPEEFKQAVVLLKPVVFAFENDLIKVTHAQRPNKSNASMTARQPQVLTLHAYH
jgi:hypothetical protein